MKKRYAIVGLGCRKDMFMEAICKDYNKNSEIVLVCDKNPGRVQLALNRIKEMSDFNPVGCEPEQLSQKLIELKVDELIVTTMDSFHDEYICLGLESGCDVITEKPMTIDEKKCKRILETQRRTGRKLRVTFNYRYSPVRTQVKDLLMSGIIGRILSVDFNWMLNLHHGADYFRRWHRWKKNSGGLLVHKATHHFDLVNWWLGTVPERVYASGSRVFYRPETAIAYGYHKRSERCLDCPESGKCKFFLDLRNTGWLNQVYLQNEKYDSYFRDRCVFSVDMDIEDTMNVVVDYRNGAKMSYSLNAFVSWEGYQISFNGTRGRLEHKCVESLYVSGDGSVQGALQNEGTYIKIFPNFQPAYQVELAKCEGGHGGGDPVMLADIFDKENQVPDKYLRAADQRAGAWSILTGVAANRSIAEKRPVNISELVENLEMPDYPQAKEDI